MKLPFIFPLASRSFLLTSLSLTLNVSAHAQDTVTPIYAVQGAGDASPLVGQTVTVEGVVTGDFQAKEQFSGFFVQDLQGDGDPATSDGIFVYVNASSKVAGVEVKIGDRVRVTGHVEEHLTQTELGRVSSLEILGQSALPAPAPIAFPLPAAASMERYEGMLVSFPEPLVVTAQNDLLRYGSLTLSAPTRLFVPTNQKPLSEVPAGYAADEEAHSSVVLDDGLGSQSPKPTPYLDETGTRRIGSTVADLTGILNFSFGKYHLQPTIAPVFVNANPRPIAPPNVGGTLKIAAANVHNYWTTLADSAHPDARGAKTAAQFARQSAKTVAEVKGLDADVLGLMELENNGETSIDDLVTRVNAAYGGPVYARVPDVAAFIGPDKIKVGLIYKPAKVTPRGAPVSDKQLIFDRYPLAQTFVSNANGGVFTIIVNHLKSKSPPTAGVVTDDLDKGEGAWNGKRMQQVAKLLEFVKQMQTLSGDPDVLSVGDYNAYTEESPILKLRAGGLTHLNLMLPPDERYSFGYDGRFGSLDHAFATPSLAAQVTGFGEWHINSDEPYFMDFPYLKIAGFVADPYRASDHDPLLVGLNLTPEKIAVKAVAKPVAKPVAKKPVAKKPVVAAKKKPPVKKVVKRRYSK